MGSKTEYAQEYQQAQKAYMAEDYEAAAVIVDRLIQDYPDDPNARLLRGHIYCYGLQQYEVAREQYQVVISLTSDPQFLEYANSGLDYANQFITDQSSHNGVVTAGATHSEDSLSFANTGTSEWSLDESSGFKFDSMNLDGVDSYGSAFETSTGLE
ncbi:MAG: chemotaxis protein, partial [Leptolyngbyaceae bacterium]|nr:chemotaxis protein [Leptolyngbyaceae bacterium]